jgi:hypothetical protein
MATANVESIAGHPERDKISQEYEAIWRKVLALQDLANDGKAIQRSNFWMQFHSKLEKECKEKAMEWKTPSYEPKRFAIDQPRVLAIESVLASFREFVDEYQTLYEQAMRAQMQMKLQYPLFKSLFIEIDRAIEAETGETLPEAPEPEVKQQHPAADETQCAAPAGTFHVLSAPFEKRGRKPAIVATLQSAGFVHETSPDGNWHWTAPYTEAADKAYAQAMGLAEKGGGIILNGWFDDGIDPNPQDDQDDWTAEAEAESVTDTVTESPAFEEDIPFIAEPETETETVTPPPAAVISNNGWRECVLCTVPVGDATDTFTALGLRRVKQSPEQEEWAAPFSAELWAAAGAMIDDDRVIEVFRR